MTTHARSGGLGITISGGRRPLSVRSLARVAATLLTGATFVACSESGPTATNQRLAIVGRVERGAVVRVVARDGASVGDSVVSGVTLSPASAGIVTGTTVRLLQSGGVTLSATTSDGRVLSTTLDVARPPTVYFDAVSGGNRDVYSVSLDGGEPARWTTAAGDDARPSVAAGTLVFSTTRDGNDELYARALASASVEQRLTTSAASETQPVLSRSGTSVAFVGDASGMPRVYVAPLSLASSVRLTSAPAAGFNLESDPTWSPAGDRIALVSTASGRANLVIASAGGGAAATPVAGSGATTTDVEPAWSPDGDHLAFASTRAGGTQIFLLDLRTGAVRQLTSGTTDAGQPGWLADGRLVFTLFEGTATRLMWLDPGTADGPVEIPTSGLALPRHAVGAR
jgi:Tol biopolymer transport system component